MNKYYEAATLVKEASVLNPAINAARAGNLTERIIPAALAIGGLSVATAATTTMSNRINQALDQRRNAKAFNQSIQEVIQNNELLRGYSPEDVQRMAQSIYRLAPQAAGDPNVLSNVLAHSMQGNGLDHRTARDLLDLEAAFQKVNNGYDMDPSLLNKNVSNIMSAARTVDLI